MYLRITEDPLQLANHLTSQTCVMCFTLRGVSLPLAARFPRFPNRNSSRCAAAAAPWHQNEDSCAGVSGGARPPATKGRWSPGRQEGSHNSPTHQGSL